MTINREISRRVTLFADFSAYPVVIYETYYTVSSTDTRWYSTITISARFGRTILRLASTGLSTARLPTAVCHTSHSRRSHSRRIARVKHNVRYSSSPTERRSQDTPDALRAVNATAGGHMSNSNDLRVECIYRRVFSSSPSLFLLTRRQNPPVLNSMDFLRSVVVAPRSCRRRTYRRFLSTMESPAERHHFQVRTTTRCVCAYVPVLFTEASLAAGYHGEVGAGRRGKRRHEKPSVFGVTTRRC